MTSQAEIVQYVKEVWGLTLADLATNPSVVEEIRENAEDAFLERHGDNRLDKAVLAYLDSGAM